MIYSFITLNLVLFMAKFTTKTTTNLTTNIMLSLSLNPVITTKTEWRLKLSFLRYDLLIHPPEHHLVHGKVHQEDHHLGTFCPQNV